jgi:hypothetical protein
VRAQLTWASPHKTLFMFISGRHGPFDVQAHHGSFAWDGLIRLISDGRVLITPWMRSPKQRCAMTLPKVAVPDFCWQRRLSAQQSIMRRCPFFETAA